MLHHAQREPDPAADATVRLTKELFSAPRRPARPALRDMVFSDELDVDGSRLDLLRFFSLLETPEWNFAIVRP